MIHVIVLGVLVLFVGAGATGVVGPTPTVQRYEATIRFADGTVGKAFVERASVTEARTAIETAYCNGKSCILEGPRDPEPRP